MNTNSVRNNEKKDRKKQFVTKIYKQSLTPILLKIKEIYKKNSYPEIVFNIFVKMLHIPILHAPIIYVPNESKKG